MFMFYIELNCELNEHDIQLGAKDPNDRNVNITQFSAEFSEVINATDKRIFWNCE